MSKRFILGIDPGTNITGYGIISSEGRDLELLTYGVIQLGKSGLDHPEKLKKIYDRISGIIQEFRPGEMALESPFQGKNPQSLLKLGRAQGVAMAAGMSQGLSIAEYAPRKVKMAVTGNGAASKQQVCHILEHILHFQQEGKFLDATDALAVAVCHAFQFKIDAGPKAKDWSTFLENHPGRVKRRGRGE